MSWCDKITERIYNNVHHAAEVIGFAAGEL
jgi:hypothetical protein